MGIIKPGGNPKAAFRSYYEGLKQNNWAGLSKPGEDFRAPYIGSSGRSKQLRSTVVLGGLYLLGSFRSTTPRLFTAGKYAVAPILPTTALGKAAKAATSALRVGQQLGAIPSELTNHYADIPVTENPAERIASIVTSRGINTIKDVRKKYGLLYNNDRSFDDDLGSASNPDLINVSFKGYRQDGVEYIVPMRGVIAGLSDTVTPNWTETSYVGRPQAVVSYGGFTREVSFDLTVAAMSGLQLRPMWEKINKVAEFVLPQADIFDTRFAGRLVKVTVGNYLKNELCAMTGFTITPNEDAMWEVMDPEVHHPSVTLERSIGSAIQDAAARKINDARIAKLEALQQNPATSDDDLYKVNRKIRKFPKTMKERRKLDKNGNYSRYVMPRVCTINISLKVLHDRVPGSNQSTDGLFKTRS